MIKAVISNAAIRTITKDFIRGLRLKPTTYPLIYTFNVYIKLTLYHFNGEIVGLITAHAGLTRSHIFNYHSYQFTLIHSTPGARAPPRALIIPVGQG